MAAVRRAAWFIRVRMVGRRGVRDWVCHQSLTSALTFSLQTEGTRLQKDLRTYLASVKGRRQAGCTWPM